MNVHEKMKAFDAFQFFGQFTFNRFFKQDKANRFNDQYKAVVAPQGRDGVSSRYRFDAFWGSRPYDMGVVSRDIDGNLVAPTCVTLSESGASLRYLQLDNGSVDVRLYPARTDTDRADSVQFIRLGLYKNPRMLLNSTILRKHWNAMYTVMENTSILGSPSLVSQAKMFWLLHGKVYYKDGSLRAPRDLVYLKKVLNYVSTIVFCAMTLKVVL